MPLLVHVPSAPITANLTSSAIQVAKYRLAKADALHPPWLLISLPDKLPLIQRSETPYYRGSYRRPLKYEWISLSSHVSTHAVLAQLFHIYTHTILHTPYPFERVCWSADVTMYAVHTYIQFTSHATIIYKRRQLHSQIVMRIALETSWALHSIPHNLITTLVKYVYGTYSNKRYQHWPP